MPNEFLRVDNMGLENNNAYLPSYDDFTIYIIIHGGHIVFLAARSSSELR